MEDYSQETLAHRCHWFVTLQCILLLICSLILSAAAEFSGVYNFLHYSVAYRRAFSLYMASPSFLSVRFVYHCKPLAEDVTAMVALSMLLPLVEESILYFPPTPATTHTSDGSGKYYL